MAKSKNTIVIILIAIVLALLAAVSYFYIDSKKKAEDLEELTEIMNEEKERVEDEYESLTYQFDGYITTIRNDSLLAELESEKQRVKDLLDELRNTRATNARRIQELKDELASVRTIMMHLVAQIDSLNTENQLLKSENQEIRMKYVQSSQAVEQLSREKEDLHEVVTRASKLEVVDFEVITLNDKNKRTRVFNRITNIQFDYTIAKNITAEPGQKTMYARIMRPDGEVMMKSPADIFPFENNEIAYSIKKNYEYGSESHQDVMYWKVEEVLYPGTYRIDFFTDGELIGSFSFLLKK